MTEQDLLERGDIEILGLLPFSSNHVFLAKVTAGDDETHAVYKPQRGERPLWDFPAGTLGAREVAAYLVSEAAGWGIVPPTMMRLDAPLGPGSLQLFIDHDPERHYFVLMHERGPEMATFAAFDVVINNADRKGGHVIEARDGRLYGVDHALSFNIEPKLRTVIWAFAEDPLEERLKSDLERLRVALAPGSRLATQLDELLSPAETAETRARLEMLLAEGSFPAPEGPFDMPWPLV
ncbi:MAG: SCO1664 family protein [Actinomycetota bacterium]